MKAELQQLLARVDKWIEDHRQEFLDEVQAMTRIPSVSRADLAQDNAPFGPDARRMLDYALRRGREYGFETKDYAGYAGAVCMGDSENALGVIGHLDVVPVGDGWIYPPFDAVYLPEHDAVVGRGADDNKGPCVAGLFAMRMLREFHYPLRHGVTLLLGLSEETGMEDMRYLLESGVTMPKTSLVPDSGFPVNYGQKGSVDARIAAPCAGNLLTFRAGTVRNVVPEQAEAVLELDAAAAKAALERLEPGLRGALSVEETAAGVRIAATGKPAHAAFPEGGVNAIHLLSRALNEAKLLQGSCAAVMREIETLTADSFGISEGAAYADEESGRLTLVYGVARLENGEMELSVDCRSSISCDQEQLMDTLRGDWQRRGFSVRKLRVSKPFYMPRTDPRVESLQALFGEMTGLDAKPFTMGGGTYSRAVPNAITFGAGMPGYGERVASFMPDGHGGAHGKDEVLLMEKVYNCARIYTIALAMLDEIVM